MTLPRASHVKPTIVYSTADRLNKRGIRARAFSWGWSQVHVEEGGNAFYVSAGTPEAFHRHHLHHHRCPCCSYADAGTIAEEGAAPQLCHACATDAAAIQALAVCEETGESWGWKLPPWEKRVEMTLAFHSGRIDGFSLVDLEKRREKNARDAARKARKAGKAPASSASPPPSPKPAPAPSTAGDSEANQLFALIFSKPAAA